MIKSGISTANHGANPYANEWAMPKCGVFFYHKGAKCISKQILPPLYIFSVLPSNYGNCNSIGTNGYFAGISNSKSYSYFTISYIVQHFPFHYLPSFDYGWILNHSLSSFLFISIYFINTVNSSFNLSSHYLSLGPAFMFNNGNFSFVNYIY